mmetsp:Transcript_46487/g.80113  ORF Transcript_46487/g.80113 Transcript_46487/m.80113 type:complete len:402 (+) Transcript_46487:56-1261(+)
MTPLPRYAAAGVFILTFLLISTIFMMFVNRSSCHEVDMDVRQQVDSQCELMGISRERCEHLLTLNFGKEEVALLSESKQINGDTECSGVISNIWNKHYEAVLNYEVEGQERMRTLRTSLSSSTQSLAQFHCQDLQPGCMKTAFLLIDDIKRFLFTRFTYDLQLFLDCNGIDLESLEGGAMTFAKKTHLMWNLVKREEVQTYCEIGFNAGHSTFIALFSNPELEVFAFDLADHQYTPLAATLVSSLFPEQFLLIAGDSTKTVPSFRSMFPDKKCNVLFVDGGHAYSIAKADIENMRTLANETFHVLVVDDVEEGFPTEAGQAWHEKIWAGEVEQIGWVDDIFSTCFHAPFHIIEEQNSHSKYLASLSIDSESYEPGAVFPTCGPMFEREDWYASIAVGRYIL